jgi:hypothetical protein
MWQVVSIPAHQSHIVGRLKEKHQSRRFGVPVAENHIGLPLVAPFGSLGAPGSIVVWLTLTPTLGDNR